MGREIQFDHIDGMVQLSHLEKCLELSLNAVEDECRSAAADWKQFHIDEGLELSDDDLEDYGRSCEIHAGVLRRQQLVSHFLSGYAIFEHTLYRVADNALMKNHSSKTVQDFRKKNNSKTAVSEFALREVGVSDAFETDAWKRVKILRDIRNCLAHDGGILAVDSMRENLEEWRAQFTGVSSQPFGYEDSLLSLLVLEPWFVRYSFKIYEEVVNSALKEIKVILAQCEAVE